MFSDKSVLIPSGTTYAVSVPDTLDLAERAARYIPAVMRTSDPQNYLAPAAAALSADFSYGAPGPRLVVPYWGAPNWGEVMLAVAEAREMTAYDRDDSHGSVTAQQAMLQNMLSPAVNSALGQNIVFPSSGITPMTYAMQAVIKTWQQTPTASMMSGIHQFTTLQLGQLKTLNNSGVDYSVFFGDLSPLPAAPSIGYLGPMYVPFIQGTALSGLLEAYSATGDTPTLSAAQNLALFLLNVQGSTLWLSPDATQFPFAATKGFAGHMYSWLETVRGLLLLADAEKISLPASSQALTAFGNGIYHFVKSRTNAGYVGSFGTGGTTTDMVMIGLLLSRLGAGDNYDEIDAWIRNQLTECEIDSVGAQAIANNSSSDWATDHVGMKATGLFFADATHLRGVPPAAQAFTTDDHAMAFRGIYEVWKHIADISNHTAYINFHLNLASKFFDLKSDIPYRGHLEIDMKPAANILTDIFVHIPAGTDRARISVSLLNDDGSESPLAVIVGVGPYANYVQISNASANAKYVVDYPLYKWTSPVYQMRSDASVWYEGSYPAVTADEVLQYWTGHFRGGTLTSIESDAPVIGIARYAEIWRTRLSALGSAETAAPRTNVTRFVHE